MSTAPVERRTVIYNDASFAIGVQSIPGITRARTRTWACARAYLITSAV